jgi:hypothetical protein
MWTATCVVGALLACLWLWQPRPEPPANQRPEYTDFPLDPVILNVDGTKGKRVTFHSDPVPASYFDGMIMNYDRPKLLEQIKRRAN